MLGSEAYCSCRESPVGGTGWFSMIYRCAGSAGDRLVKVYEKEGGKNAAKKERK